MCHSVEEQCYLMSSDGHGLAWPESQGFVLAQGGFGFPDHQARPYLMVSAWQGLAQAQATAFQECHYV